MRREKKLRLLLSGLIVVAVFQIFTVDLKSVNSKRSLPGLATLPQSKRHRATKTRNNSSRPAAASHDLQPPLPSAVATSATRTQKVTKEEKQHKDPDTSVVLSTQKKAPDASVPEKKKKISRNDNGMSDLNVEVLRERARFRRIMMVNYTRPDLDTIVDPNTNEIIGDPQFLLDFAVVGHGKCGTTTIMHWLADHPEVQSFREEIWALMFSEPEKLVQMLYHELPPGHYKRGYKAPGDITQPHVLEYFRRFFPRTRLIIGVRHPIRWFESLYNFRIQNLPDGDHMMEPNKLIGKCSKGTHQTCTEKGNYAFNLLRLGKSNYNATTVRQPTSLEEKIVGRFKRDWFNVSQVPYMPNPVFLFEMGQLSDHDVERKAVFRRDFQSFMGLKRELPEIGHYRPGMNWAEEKQREKDLKKIDICEDQHKPVRRELLWLGRLSSRWIREVFLDSHDVVVSSRHFFEELLLAWERDPCSVDSDVIHLNGPMLRFPTT